MRQSKSDSRRRLLYPASTELTRRFAQREVCALMRAPSLWVVGVLFVLVGLSGAAPQEWDTEAPFDYSLEIHVGKVAATYSLPREWFGSPYEALVLRVNGISLDSVVQPLLDRPKGTLSAALPPQPRCHQVRFELVQGSDEGDPNQAEVVWFDENRVCDPNAKESGDRDPSEPEASDEQVLPHTSRGETWRVASIPSDDILYQGTEDWEEVTAHQASSPHQLPLKQRKQLSEAAGSFPRAEQSNFDVGIDAFASTNTIPLRKLGVQTLSASPQNQRSQLPDIGWILYQRDQELVLFHDAGPGLIARMLLIPGHRELSPEWEAGCRLRVRIDGELVFDEAFQDLYKGTGLLQPPIARAAIPGGKHGHGWWCNLPFRYNSEASVSVFYGSALPEDVMLRQFLCLVKQEKCDTTLVWDISYQKFDTVPVNDGVPRAATNTTAAMLHDAQILTTIMRNTEVHPLASRWRHGSGEPSTTTNKATSDTDEPAMTTLVIPAHGYKTLLRSDVGGVVSRLLISVGDMPTAWDTTELLAWFDDQVEPQIHVKLGAFFGSTGHKGNVEGKGPLLGMIAESSTGFCHLPMPYLNSAKILIRNRAAIPISLSLRLDVSSLTKAMMASPDDVGHLNCIQSEERFTTVGDDYTLAALSRGWGHMVAITLYAEETLQYADDVKIIMQEGDPKVRVDGAKSISYSNTGFEDHFGFGHGFPPGRNYHMGTAGFSLIGGANQLQVHHQKDWKSISQAFDYGTKAFAQAYRNYVADFIPFSTELRFSWEHGSDVQKGEISQNVEGGGKVLYHLEDHLSWEDNALIGEFSSALHWYGRRVAGSIVTDTLTVRQPLSSHEYVSTEMRNITADGYWMGTFCTPDWAFVELAALEHSPAATITFTVTTDPKNRGVTIRRSFKFWPAHQAARVFVDGVAAGVWFDAGFSAYDLNLRDSTFFIPPQLVRGKASVKMKLQVITAWVDIDYIVKSIL